MASAQAKYLNGPIEVVKCACGCDGDVVRRRVHYFPSYLKKTGGALPRFLPGHNGTKKAVAARAAQLKGITGEAAPRWKGGETLQDGYRYIRIGRCLKSNEVVHHIDGDRLNNDPGNLEVMTRAEHARHHAEERYA